MSNQEVVEVVYGKYHKYEIVKSIGFGVKFNILRDGEHWKSGYSDLRKAVEAAEKAG